MARSISSSPRVCFAPVLVLLVGGGAPAAAQRATSMAEGARRFVAHDPPTIALTSVRVIDGTGSGPRALGRGRVHPARGPRDRDPRNGARILGIDGQVGTLEVGKRADAVVIRGNPAVRIGEMGNPVLVFRDGIGYDSSMLIAAVEGLVGRF